MDPRLRDIYKVLGRELIELLRTEDINEETMHAVWKLFEVEP